MSKYTYVLALLLCCGGALSPAEIPELIKSPHREAISLWLGQHPTYRLANRADCDCSEDIHSLRTGCGGTQTAEPSYEPFYATGDFNGDGLEDAAVIMMSSNLRSSNLVVAFFQRSPNKSDRPREIPIRERDIGGLGLFSRKPSPSSTDRRWRLLFGAFESEAEQLLPVNRRER
jgi:hypothetical protein